MADYEIFAAGDVVLQSGLTYRNARLAYKTYGTLAADKSNVIVYPTSYGAQHMTSNGGRRRAGARPDPVFHHHRQQVRQRALVLAEQHAAAVRPGRYPQFTMTDNVRVQQRLLAEVFGIERVALVYGFSMGAQQAFHWGALFPDRVERIARSAARPRLRRIISCFSKA